MPQKTRAELKVYYKEGSDPSQEQHHDLIDSLLNIVDDSTGVLQPSPLAHTLFVDPNASGLGIRGNVYQPYSSPNLALADAVSGDTIILLPGIYTCTNLYKSGITYYAFPGVQITHEDPSSALFDDTDQVSGICTVKGNANFTETTVFINVTQATSICIEATSLSIGNSSVPALSGSALGNVILKIKNISSDSSTLFIYNTGCSIQLYFDVLNITNTTNSSGILQASGNDAFCTIEGNEITATNYDPSLQVSLFIINFNATLLLKKSKINTTASTIVDARTGSLLADTFSVSMNNSSGQCIAFYGSPLTTLKNIDIFHSLPLVTDYSLLGAAEIVGIVNANFPMQASTSVTIGEFNYDTNLFI